MLLFSERDCVSAGDIAKSVCRESMDSCVREICVQAVFGVG